MSKNELRIIAKISLIGVGLYVIMQAILGTMSGLPYILASAHKGPLNASTIFPLVVYIVLLLGGVYLLFRFADYFSAKIVATVPADDTQISWLSAAFRLICVTAGLLFLYWTGFSGFATLTIHSYYNSGQSGLWYKAEIVKFVVLLILSIYLACGAPGFVRWQVKRTLRQCGKFEEQKSL